VDWLFVLVTDPDAAVAGVLFFRGWSEVFARKWRVEIVVLNAEHAVGHGVLRDLGAVILS
jgi:hypothetical protein